ncbi:UPF0547 protein C16orf87 homolog [Montipora foliosa]|uniref:UPF0547 protein C16orf87 homolog n=1 Tax=Montipora foliosa TaxID=591990 RepID=UPI0035F1181D
MVLQQCLACNSWITKPSRSCSCGHVFEDQKQVIGGKRFSEYRAMLYCRLENRRRREEKRKNTKVKRLTQGEQPHRGVKNQLSELPEQSLLKATVIPEKPRRSAAAKTSNKTKRRKESASKQQNKICLPQDLYSRFPSALQGINRKILGQNLLWLELVTE